jgi:hypothetical protein
MLKIKTPHPQLGRLHVFQVEVVIHVVPVENLKVAESGWRADDRAAYVVPLTGWPVGSWVGDLPRSQHQPVLKGTKKHTPEPGQARNHLHWGLE